MSDFPEKNRQALAAYVLNLNGFSFESRVIRELFELSASGETGFKFYLAEYPVSCREKSTHVDFIFQDGGIFLTGECKRKYTHKEWLFFRSFAGSGSSSYSIPKYADTLTESRGFNDVFRQNTLERTLTVSEIRNSDIPDDALYKVYNLGFAVENAAKLLKKMNKGNKPKLLLNDDNHLDENSFRQLTKEDHRLITDDSIYAAVNQVMLSSSGLINDLIRYPLYPSNLNGNFNFHFIPAIVTNADLFVCDTDLSDTSLITGNLNSATEPTNVGYVWFGFHRPQELQPLFEETADTDFEHFIVRNRTFYGSPERRFLRTVLIINSEHLRQALSLPFRKMLG